MRNITLQGRDHLKRIRLRNNPPEAQLRRQLTALEQRHRFSKHHLPSSNRQLVGRYKMPIMILQHCNQSSPSIHRKPACIYINFDEGSSWGDQRGSSLEEAWEQDNGTCTSKKEPKEKEIVCSTWEGTMVKTLKT
ncbi:hypothetical protein COP1_028186 [Malus domestica]